MPVKLLLAFGVIAAFFLSEEDPGVRHTRLQLTLGLLSEIWVWVVLIAVLYLGLSPHLRDLSRKLTGGRFGSLSPYIVLLSILLAVLGLPFSFYSGFVVEHEFGLSNQDMESWFSDFAKSLGLGIAINLVLLNAVYFVLRRSPHRWWLYGASVVVAFSVVLAMLAPILITPLFNKFEPLQDQALKEQIIALEERSGVKVVDVLQVDASQQSNTVNAYFIGLGPTKRIVLYDTLLANLNRDEVLTVVAHETGHQVHNDIWRSIGFSTIATFAGFYLLCLIAGPLVSRFQGRFGFSRLDDPASLPLALLLVGLLSFFIQPVDNTFSRYVEHEADRFALEATHQNEAYVVTMEKLAQINVSDPDPPAWMVFLFYSHPSVKERIEFARTYHPWSG